MYRNFRRAALALCLVAISRADLDLNSNGLSDVWESKFGPAVITSGQDSDGDGRTNLEESEAGTDPQAGSDFFAVRQIIPQGANLLLKWPSQAGKRYQVQSSETPSVAGSWVTLPGQHAGVAGDLSVTTPRPLATTAFFRVIVADVDTDGDGLTDWEEIQTGFNPNAGNDMAALTAALQATSTITITTADAEATEPTSGPAADSASFRVRRSGGIGRVLVKLESSGSASATDYTGVPTTVAVPLASTEVMVPVIPVADILTESDELAVLSVKADAAYSRGAAVTAGVLIKDGMQPIGTGLLASFWKHPNNPPPTTTPTLNTPYFTGVPVLTRTDPTVNFNSDVAVWPGSPITVSGASIHFSSRWEGEVLPEYSQAYTFHVDANEMCRLWVNGQLLPLASTTSPYPLIDTDWENPPVVPTQNGASAVVSLEAGKRYPIVLEHYQNTGGHKAILSWQSASISTRQVIPQNRLFPNAPPRIYAPFEALTFVGGPAFSYQIKASATPTSYSAVNLPPGFTLGSTGLITGTPATPGEWKVMLTATNATGSGSAFLNITILQTSGGITRELWTEVGGSGVAQIPVADAPDSTSILSSLAAPSDSGEDYGARLRGFITAPETGEYRFYLRADEAAVFYLSDDEEPVNAWKRAELTAPVSSTDWTSATPSPLLHLEAGRRYYLEVLHKESGGTDHLAVGWLTPSEMAKATPVIATVPGHLLTRFEHVVLGNTPAFVPPPAPPDWTTEDDTGNDNFNAASRFLQQATFGASSADITALTGLASFDEWIDDEFEKQATRHLPYVEQFRNVSNPNNNTYPGTLSFNSWWKNSIQGEDQLRQRIAFALSEIMVISESGPLDERANTISDYYDVLLDHSFGNVRDLLEAVTLHPAMGRYLDMLNNNKPSLSAGRIPNENYAREILQLFSLGLYRLHPDGSPMLNSKGELIPVYDQDSIIGYAHVFTGWGYNYTGSRTTFPSTSNWIDPMREVPACHFTGKKRLLNNVVLPGIPVLNGTPLNPYGDHTIAPIANNPEFQALPALELDAVHDQLFQHPNIGPFLCSQLIQRLVTSTPTPGYVYRVVQKFNDNGSGVRGDMKAVIKAILLDYEARSLEATEAPGFGKQREPVVRVTQLARAFRPENNFAGTYAQDGGLITVNTGAMAHRLANNQKVLLGFSGTGTQSHDGDYTLFATPPANSFTVRTRDIFRGTWSQPLDGNLITVTSTSGDHGFATGQSAYLRFRTGIAGTLVSGIFPVTRTGNTTFTVTAPDIATAARSGDIDIAVFRGGYSQLRNNADLIVTCGTLPGLVVGGKLTMSFIAISNPAPPDGVYVIDTVAGTEPRRFTLKREGETTPPPTTLDRTGTFNAAPHAPILNRSGTVVSGYSDWNVGNTDTALGQTPLGAPTVFNFFEPGYKFPGLLADSGLVTPEFQISSDTNVIRQANFLFAGIYHTTSTTGSGSLTAGYTNGFSSFVGGAHDIMMDFSKWMGPRPSATGNWTDTPNLRALIQELSGILMGRPASTALENEIYNYVSINTGTGYIAYPATPTETDRRNRIRAVLYFIAVSPEHAIQR
ncbi:DUF1800 family protein [Luteolibacter arcticus]|uniref:DUF1800 family protein n=1 Tax=Luteolibacter arcticus TaxID=1581411 RepID=A0ABT3GPC3_9BACT|nr:DUF1800 family protein [Luteolibacter arcticus]MCW1925344.1 DUF1800 family protein [Luteolibacter arcticus]